MPLAIIFIITAVLFILILSILGLQPKILNRFMGRVICVTGIAGILLYGYGYYYLYGASGVTVLRTLISAFGIFLGHNDIKEISEVPLLATEPMQVILYLISIIAVYATVSTVIAGFGSRLIGLLKLWTVHRKDVTLIYGVNRDSVRFAEKLMKDKKGRKEIVLFAGKDAGTELSSRIAQMGAVLLNDAHTSASAEGLIRKIGLHAGRQRFSVFCLDINTTENIRYAENLRNLLEKAGIRPSQTSLSLMAPEGFSGSFLQAGEHANAGGPEKYGFGSVFAIEPEELAARLLIRRFPPYKTLKFDENAAAQENFEVLVIGFGKTGQAVLRALLMNGQFEGSRFHATIIADRYSTSSGRFFYAYPGIRENADIDILEINSRSIACYEYLSQAAGSLKMVVVCTGDDRENNEVTSEISGFLRTKGCRAQVIQCTDRGLISYSKSDGLPVTEDVFEPDILCMEKPDAMAKILNHEYHRSENLSPEQDWAAADYFSRQSCRGSADFLDAFIGMSGLRPEEVREKGWPDDPALLENLARTEHRRWCAFHYANGYRCMSRETFDRRGNAYEKERGEKGISRIRIGKDTERKLHACLIPWEELDALAEREMAYTGVRKDYRKMDLDNILMIPRILQIGKEADMSGLKK